MTKNICIALLALGVAGPAWAQGDALSQADKAYLTKEASGAAYEMKSATLAAGKATRADVKNYAAKIAADHQTYNAALQKLGKEQGIKLPEEPDDADKARMRDLEQASGAAFDALYLKEARRVNKEDKDDAEKERASTRNEAIRKFMDTFQAMDAEHEKLAEQVQRGEK